MKKGICTFFVLCTLLIGGCAKKEAATIRPKPMTLAERKALQSLTERRAEIQTVRAAGRLFAWDRGELVTEIALALEFPDHIRIETMDSLADVTAMVGSDGKRVWVWLPAENKLYRGRATKRNLRRIVHVDWEVSDLAHILAGVVDVVSDDYLQQDDGDTNLFVVQGKSIAVRMDMKRGLPTIVNYPRYEVRFQEYRDVGGIMFPHRIVAHVPGKGTRVVFEYNHVELNREVLEKVFQPPDV
jgi:outer membrane lipoprotein-sorting protein